MLYLLRGPSGSGKTTFANKLLAVGLVDHVFEADQFMVDKAGNYQHDRTRLQECHSKCENLTREALERGASVAVANTMTKRWEVARYFDMCDNVTVLTMEGKFPNAHGVPNSVVGNQRKRFERW